MANNYFFKSDTIKVFPSGFRSSVAEALTGKLTTEENIISQSFGESDFLITNPKKNSSTSYLLRISGYLFEIDKESKLYSGTTSISELEGDYYIGIYLSQPEGIAKYGYILSNAEKNIDDVRTLDVQIGESGNYIFKGLFITDDVTLNNTGDTGVNISKYIGPVKIKLDSTGFSIDPSSLFSAISHDSNIIMESTGNGGQIDIESVTDINLHSSTLASGAEIDGREEDPTVGNISLIAGRYKNSEKVATANGNISLESVIDNISLEAGKSINTHSNKSTSFTIGEGAFLTLDTDENVNNSSIIIGHYNNASDNTEYVNISGREINVKSFNNTSFISNESFNLNADSNISIYSDSNVSIYSNDSTSLVIGNESALVLDTEEGINNSVIHVGHYNSDTDNTEYVNVSGERINTYSFDDTSIEATADIKINSSSKNIIVEAKTGDISIESKDAKLNLYLYNDITFSIEQDLDTEEWIYHISGLFNNYTSYYLKNGNSYNLINDMFLGTPVTGGSTVKYSLNNGVYVEDESGNLYFQLTTTQLGEGPDVSIYYLTSKFRTTNDLTVECKDLILEPDSNKNINIDTRVDRNNSSINIGHNLNPNSITRGFNVIVKDNYIHANNSSVLKADNILRLEATKENSGASSILALDSGNNSSISIGHKGTSAADSTLSITEDAVNVNISAVNNVNVNAKDSRIQSSNSSTLEANNILELKSNKENSGTSIALDIDSGNNSSISIGHNNNSAADSTLSITESAVNISIDALDSVDINSSKNINLTAPNDDINIIANGSGKGIKLNVNTFISEDGNTLKVAGENTTIQGGSISTSNISVDKITGKTNSNSTIINDIYLNSSAGTGGQIGSNVSGKMLTLDGVANYIDISSNSSVSTPSGNYSTLREALLDMIYPVGAIYMSVSGISPSTFLGGKWERIEGCFLYAGEGDKKVAPEVGGKAPLDSGGSDDAVIVSHNHSFNASGNVSISPNPHTHWLHLDFDYPNKTDNLNDPIVRSSSYEDGRRYTSDANSSQYYNETTELTASFTGDGGVSADTGVDGTNKNMPHYNAVYVWKRTE